MIIKYPTGFYKNEIPQEPSDSGNITFLISNKAPDRTDLYYTKIPLGVLSRQLEEKTNNRSSKGQRIFSISSSLQINSESGDKQYILGDVLDFEDASPLNINPMLVPEMTQLQHNINAINYNLLDLNDSDISAIESAVENQQKQLIASLNSLRSQRATLEVTIVSQQKQINDIDRAINATKIANTDGSLNSIIDKLTNQKNSIYISMKSNIDSANTLAESANIVLNDLRSIGIILK